MIRFLLAIIFGGTIVLTPRPVTVVNAATLVIPSVSSIDGYGSLQLDVSSMIPASLGPFKSRARALETFPPGCIQATLFQGDGPSSVALNYSGESVFTENGLRIMLTPSREIPYSAHFDRLRISTSVPLDIISIYWRNVQEK